MPNPRMPSATRSGHPVASDTGVGDDQDTVHAEHPEVVADLVGCPRAELQLRSTVGEDGLGVGR